MVRRPAYLILGIALAAGLAACGGTKLPTVLHAAPEPAVAPPPTGTPAGLVIPLGYDTPEGVVVDAGSQYVVVATRDPGRLVVLSVGSLQVLHTIDGVGAARHLELATGGEQVIVAAEDLDVVSVVDIPDGTVASRAKVGRQPHDDTDLDGTIVVADELGGAVTATKGDTALGTISGLAQPGGVAQAAGFAAVVDVRARLLDVYGVNPFRMTGRVAVGAGPTHAVGLGNGTVAVADTDGGEVFIVAIDSAGKPRVVGTLPVPDQPYGMGVDLPRHRLWIASSGDDTLRQFTIGASPGVPTLGPTYVTVQQPNSLAIVPSTGDVIVAGATTAGTLQEITP